MLAYATDSYMLKVKIADTPYYLERGLMFVQNLPDDEGMLFVFPRPTKMNFWGKDTFIPLDVAFIDRDRTIVKIARIKPFSLEAVSSDINCLFAIEANAGYFEQQKVKVGSKVEFERYQDAVGVGEVRFSANIEGTLNENKNNNAKQAQVDGLNIPKIGKPNEQPIGEPVGQPPAQQENLKDLPIISPSDLGKYLEDSFDEETEVPGMDEVPPQGTPLPSEVEQPAEVPQDQPQEQPQEEKKYPQFSNAYQAMDWAEHDNEVVRISYTSKKGRQITRDIEPHGSFHSESTGRQILVTFDETVGDVRAFIIHNISQWAFVGKKFNKKFVVRA